MTNFIKKIFNIKIENSDVLKKYSFFLFKKIEISLLHYKKETQDEHPFNHLNDTMNMLLKGEYYTKRYLVLRHNITLSECYCFLPEICVMDTLDNTKMDIGHIEFLFPWEVIQKINIRPHTYILQIVYKQCDKHVQEYFYINKEKNRRERREKE